MDKESKANYHLSWMIIDVHLEYLKYLSDYAAEAMSWACEQGLITGKNSTLLKPQDFATRAEIALVLTRYCEMF